MSVGSGGHKRVVLCAVDASVHSRNAFDWYLSNVWTSGDLVVVVYCPEVPNLPYLSFKKGIALPVDKWKDLMSEVHKRTWKLEEEYEFKCRERKLSYKVVAETGGHPGESICQLAEREGAGMIVMGSRGMGAVKRFFLGSVSEYVVRHSSIPTVVIPAR